MFKEFELVRQVETSFRRLFIDENLSLYVWYPSRLDKEILGFQLVYGSGTEDKALTWTKENGFSHLKVDEGDKGINKTPILVVDGSFEYDRISRQLTLNLIDLEVDIRELVQKKVKEYRKLAL